MNKKEYGEKFNEHLLEQYKVFAETLDRISLRRSQMHRYYASILSGLLVFLSLIVFRGIFTEYHMSIFRIIGILGIVLCIIWFLNIKLFAKAFDRQYQVIHEMEKHLPFPCFTKLSEYFEEHQKKFPIIMLVDRYVPFILIIPFLLLIKLSCSNQPQNPNQAVEKSSKVDTIPIP